MRLFLYLGLIPWLLASCQADPQAEGQSDGPSAVSANELDLSRSNPVKNTPSRASTESPRAPGPAVPVAEVEGPLYPELPPGRTVPEGMVFVPGGTFEMGSAEGLPREKPIHQRSVQGFFMDQHPVTVKQFRQFVAATSYRTQAETYGDAAVFDLGRRQWYLQVGASWEYPRGRKAGPAPDDHPVTQVSWNDAQAYCRWAGKRLPTEAEWEHAARNGQNLRTRYPWGQHIQNDRGEYRANVWQGTFPALNTRDDGYLYTCPVGTFGTNELGLSDMSGNVWEWCQNWYRSYDARQPGRVQTAEPERAMRGGSFMCHPSYCHGYRVSGRSGSTPETGLFHVGFRPVQDL